MLWSLFKVNQSSHIKTGSQLDRRHPWNAQKFWRVGRERKKVNGMIGKLITVDLKANLTSKMHLRMLCNWGRHKSIMHCWKFGCATWYGWHYSNLGAQLNWRRTIICEKLIEKKMQGLRLVPQIEVMNRIQSGFNKEVLYIGSQKYCGWKYGLHKCDCTSNTTPCRLHIKVHAMSVLNFVPLAREKAPITSQWMLSNRIMPEIWHDLVN